MLTAPHEEQCGKVWIVESKGYWWASSSPVEYVLVDRQGRRLSVHNTLDAARTAARRIK